MKPREKIKKEHEYSVISDFLKWYNQKCSTNFKINETPDFTDAIACDGNVYLWIEHANVYRNQYEAKEEWSHVVPGEQPFKLDGIVQKDFFELFAEAFISVLESKLYKSSYENLFSKYGKGILLLSERDQLFFNETWKAINRKLSENNFPNDNGYFERVYLAHRNHQGLQFIEIKYKIP